MYPSHDKDVYGWAVHTAQLLREKKMSEVDFEGIIEEIGSDKYELINRLSLDNILADAYDIAISKAAKETSLDERDFPTENAPNTFEKPYAEESLVG